MNIERFFEKVNPWVLVIIAIIIAIVIYLLYTSLTASSNTGHTVVSDASSYNPSGLTMSTQNLDIITDAIFNDMNSAALIGANDSDLIIQFQKLGSADDINYVVYSFGTKPLFLNGEATNFFTKMFSPTLNLYGWLKSECSSSTLTTIGGIFSNFGLTLQ